MDIAIVIKAGAFITVENALLEVNTLGNNYGEHTNF